MNIGQFRHSIKIEQLTTTIDDYGAQVEAWQHFMTLKCQLKTTGTSKASGGSKGINNDEIFNSKSQEFTCYYRKGINEDMEIIYENERYKINSISEIGFKVGICIRCEKINE